MGGRDAVGGAIRQLTTALALVWGMWTSPAAAGEVRRPFSSQPPGRHAVDACQLLTDAQMEAVQGAAAKDRTGRQEKSGSLHLSHCVFQPLEFVKSVSVTVITAPPGSGPAALRDYWKNFRKSAKRPPRPVSEIGRDAVWAGDPRAGALYVLTDDAIVRVSVGGPGDEEEKIRKTIALSRAILSRLAQTD